MLVMIRRAHAWVPPDKAPVSPSSATALARSLVSRVGGDIVRAEMYYCGGFGIGRDAGRVNCSDAPNLVVGTKFFSADAVQACMRFFVLSDLRLLRGIR